MNHRMIFLACMTAFALVQTNVHANEIALQKCRGISEAGARLACYDAILLTSSTTPPIKGVATAPAGTKAGGSAAVPAPAPGANDTAADFGLPSVVRAAQLEKIESSIVGRFVSWQTGSRITLANGQVWLVTDDSRGICECDNPKVVVTRASFGTFFLDIEGKGNSPRVRRVK